MPRKKLTLTVDERVIEEARRYSAQHATSISRLVTHFLAKLPTGERKYGPTVERLIGRLPSDVNTAAYYRHLEEKHGPR